MRVVKVPWTDKWLTRFNRRFAVDKSSYDGHFKSRLCPGYCIDALWYMEYTFLDAKPKARV